LRARVPRAAGRANPLIHYRDLVLDPALHQVRLRDEGVELSPRAYTILLILLQAHGRVLSRQQLEEKLYSFDASVESNAVEVHIHHLRKKLGADYILMMRGVGYLMPPGQGDCGTCAPGCWSGFWGRWWLSGPALSTGPTKPVLKRPMS